MLVPKRRGTRDLPDEWDDSSMPNLRVSRDEAERRLKERIEQGKRLLERFQGFSPFARVLHGTPTGGFEEIRNEYRKWDEFNVDLLKSLFDKPIISKKYEFDFGNLRVGQSEVESTRGTLEKKIVHLESLLGRLSLHQEPGHVEAALRPSVGGAPASNEVFIVHGQNVAAKEETARYLERLGLQVVILHEKPNKGRTLIEKFEDYSSVGFAVVLLTPDDVGGPAPATPNDRLERQSPRARQNVIFELGYFLGKLGREKVCALYKQGVELPSDMEGILYVPLDDKGAWRLALAREIKTAGFDIDMNKAL